MGVLFQDGAFASEHRFVRQFLAGESAGPPGRDKISERYMPICLYVM
jgi:hypothetical protein